MTPRLQLERHYLTISEFQRTRDTIARSVKSAADFAVLQAADQRLNDEIDAKDALIASHPRVIVA